MIRNIPNKYTQGMSRLYHISVFVIHFCVDADMLLDEISEFLASFDLLYLPVDVYPQVVDKQEVSRVLSLHCCSLSSILMLFYCGCVGSMSMSAMLFSTLSRPNASVRFTRNFNRINGVNRVF